MAKICTSKAMIALVLAGVLSVGTAGCAGSSGPAPSFTLPSLPSVGTLQPQANAAPEPTATPAAATALDENKQPVVVAIDRPVGSATELYSRIATGAMSCWFPVGGPLKTDYIYHATADAPSRGGKAKIVIHRRDPSQPNPRGPKAYLIDITPSGETTATIKTENRKMPDAFASAMTEDVGRWSKGEQGCAGSSAVAGWLPAQATDKAAAATPPKSKAKKKPKLKAAQATASPPHHN